MPRPLRIEYAGAIYHLMNRGDWREPIFLDDQDRRTFLRTLHRQTLVTRQWIANRPAMGSASDVAYLLAKSHE